MVTPERIRQLLIYSPDTGEFTYRVRTGNKAAGKRAGYLGNKGYWKLNIDGREYMAHRVAWAAFYGCWPRDSIDHIDGQRSNNRIANLRECVPHENMQNLAKLKRRKGGDLPTGVTWKPKVKRFHAKITLRRKCYHLGYYATAEEASFAYTEAKKKLHQFEPVGRAAS